MFFPLLGLIYEHLWTFSLYLFQKPHARDHILVVGFTKLSADKFLQPVFDLATGADEQLVYHGCASLPLLSAGKRAIPKTHSWVKSGKLCCLAFASPTHALASAEGSPFLLMGLLMTIAVGEV